MKFNIQYKFTAILLLAGVFTVTAQKKDENIGTEVVNVVKPYTPTISDAFKVKETPSLEDEDNTKKENIKYDIFSFPVASTFTPSKGRAAGVDKTKQERLFKNYFTSGFGNYLTAFAELYVTEEIGESDYVAGMVKHLSSNGGIKDAELDDKFLNTSIDLTYGSKQDGYSWNADAGYQIQKYYWYGLPADYGLTVLSMDQRAAVVDRIDEMQTYNNAYVSGRVGFNESIFNSIDLKYNRFWDAYGSAENRFYIKPSFQFDISENTIKTEVIADYVGGEFDTDLHHSTPVKYAFANFGIHPSFAMQRQDWSFNIGASVFYSADTENSDNKLFVYPNVKASLKVVGDLMVFYLGADGTLQQNSFRDLTNENPYLSPYLTGTRPNEIGLKPTDKQLDGFAGLKGKLSNYISYNVRGSLVAERNKILFKHNTYDEPELIQEMYDYGNSFGIVYDNVRTLTFFGEVKADFNKNISFGINGAFHKYTTKFEAEAWNLPEIQFGANLDVTITPKWYAGTNLFFIGERKDFEEKLNALPGTVKTLNSYFDANVHVGYKYSERLTAWLRFNNIANQAYEKWLNYPVQSFQAMIGASYKFDF
ncbi:MAG TPA: hypothetical protein VK528_03455 [Flavobacterium sp.]|nr:hypothetical protein [Flavobacterium sp.]